MPFLAGGPPLQFPKNAFVEKKNGKSEDGGLFSERFNFSLPSLPCSAGAAFLGGNFSPPLFKEEEGLIFPVFKREDGKRGEHVGKEEFGGGGRGH